MAWRDERNLRVEYEKKIDRNLQAVILDFPGDLPLLFPGTPPTLRTDQGIVFNAFVTPILLKTVGQTKYTLCISSMPKLDTAPIPIMWWIAKEEAGGAREIVQDDEAEIIKMIYDETAHGHLDVTFIVYYQSGEVPALTKWTFSFGHVNDKVGALSLRREQTARLKELK